jgi:hypothetical protein
MAHLNSITLKFSILLFVIFAFENREINAISYRKVTVTIINGAAPDPSPTDITVHCKSKDDDLGFHTLMHEQSYMFSFRPRFPRGTLFFCSFTWKESPLLHYLDIYSFKRDDCRNCSWRINKAGGCKYLKETGSFSSCIAWNSFELIMDANSTFKM